ncbi:MULTISPECIES: hypothetical protein [unclassified Ensifer]
MLVRFLRRFFLGRLYFEYRLGRDLAEDRRRAWRVAWNMACWASM